MKVFGRRSEQPAMSNDAVLVIGATPDYVARINHRYPDLSVFLVDSTFKGDPFLESIDQDKILFSELEDHDRALGLFTEYLAVRRVSPNAVACFDCERLILASKAAHELGMPFPSQESIAHCRNKAASRKIWQNAGIRTCRSILAQNVEDTAAFFRFVGKDIVLKPISASGAELVLHCRNLDQVRKNVWVMRNELPKRAANPLFQAIPQTSRYPAVNPCTTWVAEEYIQGPEFSCDFVLKGGEISIVRETGKIKDPDQGIGCIAAYVFPPIYPDSFSLITLKEVLKIASTALGFDWGYFMADYIIEDGYPYLIEITPRPGGDSIPDLIEMATGTDILGLYLDFISEKKTRLSRIVTQCAPLIMSINLFAERAGIITRMDTSLIQAQPWVKGLQLRRNAGDLITLPPRDYDSWLLGYAIVSNPPERDALLLQDLLQNLLRISIDPENSIS